MNKRILSNILYSWGLVKKYFSIVKFLVKDNLGYKNYFLFYKLLGIVIINYIL